MEGDTFERFNECVAEKSVESVQTLPGFSDLSRAARPRGRLAQHHQCREVSWIHIARDFRADRAAIRRLVEKAQIKKFSLLRFRLARSRKDKALLSPARWRNHVAAANTPRPRCKTVSGSPPQPPVEAKLIHKIAA
jgi:hypothetical protein